jgi:hypothetical protein
MKRQVRVFVEGQQLDLFNDEVIEVTSTIQNIQDISKTFTDFSQSFTIPTSPKNNSIWEYFYENALNSSINYQERLDGYIEIDMTFFRRGKIQMEKSQLKNGQPDSYTITFYGDVTTLKDLVGEDLLSDLDYTPINHTYSFAEVYQRITNGAIDWDVCYPLITSNRIWEYGAVQPTATLPNWLPFVNIPMNTNDIRTNQGAIDYRELFPAVRVASIFNLIENRYGVNFTGTFLSDPKFTQSYLWFKNRNNFAFTSQPENITLNSFVGGGGHGIYNLIPYVDILNSTVTLNFLSGVSFHNVYLFISNNSNPTIPFYIDVYQNGTLYATWNGLGYNTNGNLVAIPNVQGLNDVYTFQLRSDVGLSIDFLLTYSVDYVISSVSYNDFVDYSTNTITTSATTNLAWLAPTMKVQDFVSGILKEYNLTCYGTAPNTYEVIPLDDWYSAGAIIDITKFTDKTEIGIDRVKLYKKIAFRYQQSNSFMNKAFFDQALREYGNTEYQYPYDGGEFNVELPFENLLFNQFFELGNPTGLQVGYSLDSAFAPYIPKPCLLYKFGSVTLPHHIHYTDGTGNVTNPDYVMFGQDLKVLGIDYSLNFAPETSTYWLQVINQSMFRTYYFPYLTNLFNPKNRLTTIKANLPTSLLTSLQLNDRLVIRDKRYLINQMKTNMVTGETTFELLNDFMPISPIRIIQVGYEETNIDIGINLPNQAYKATFSSGQSDVIIDPLEITQSQVINITLSVDQVTTIFVVYDLTNGETQDETINIIRQTR